MSGNNIGGRNFRELTQICWGRGAGQTVSLPASTATPHTELKRAEFGTVIYDTYRTCSESRCIIYIEPATPHTALELAEFKVAEFGTAIHNTYRTRPVH